MPPSSAVHIIHATSVRVEGRAAVIIGKSGAGKSALALQMIAAGAALVADDRTILRREDGMIVADVPDAIAGLIEARGVGLIQTPTAGPTPVAVVIDLDRTEHARLPERHSHTLLGMNLPCFWNVPQPYFASAILLWLKAGIPPDQ